MDELVRARPELFGCNGIAPGREQAVAECVYDHFRETLARGHTFSAFMKNISLGTAQMHPVLGMPAVPVHFRSLEHTAELGGLRNLASEPRVGVRLQDCLGAFLKSEEVVCRCEACGENTMHTLVPGLTVLPEYLIIQLKRFSYHAAETKVNTCVDFPIESLVLGSAQYRLISCCSHIEIGMGCGHYTAHVRCGDAWYCCNDSVISKVGEVDKRRAYVLFYERVS